MVAKDGSNREHTFVECINCNQNFWKQSRFVEKATGNHYCTRTCLYEYKNRIKNYEYCSKCDKRFTVKKSRVLASKSGFIFCSRKCKDMAQIIENGFYEMHPEHYDVGGYTYRKKAFKHLNIECSVCGYDIEEVLQVHHKDSNRKNNKLANLDILCPTHHKEYDLGLRKYID